MDIITQYNQQVRVLEYDDLYSYLELDFIVYNGLWTLSCCIIDLLPYAVLCLFLLFLIGALNIDIITSYNFICNVCET